MSSPQQLWCHLVDTKLPVWFVIELTQRVMRDRRASGFTPVCLEAAKGFLKGRFLADLTNDGLRAIITDTLAKLSEAHDDMACWKLRYQDASTHACTIFSLVASDIRVSEPQLAYYIHLTFDVVEGDGKLTEHIIVQLALKDDSRGGVQTPPMCARITVEPLDTSRMKFPCQFWRNSARTEQEFEAVKDCLNPSGLLKLCVDDTIVTTLQRDSIDDVRRQFFTMDPAEQQAYASRLLAEARAAKGEGKGSDAR